MESEKIIFFLSLSSFRTSSATNCCSLCPAPSSPICCLGTPMTKLRLMQMSLSSWKALLLRRLNAP